MTSLVQPTYSPLLMLRTRQCREVLVVLVGLTTVRPDRLELQLLAVDVVPDAKDFIVELGVSAGSTSKYFLNPSPRLSISKRNISVS
jgi:hypothetical protein